MQPCSPVIFTQRCSKKCYFKGRRAAFPSNYKFCEENIWISSSSAPFTVHEVNVNTKNYGLVQIYLFATTSPGMEPEQWASLFRDLT